MPSVGHEVRQSQGSSAGFQTCSLSIPAVLTFIFLPPIIPYCHRVSLGPWPWARDWGFSDSESWVLGIWRLCHVRGSCFSVHFLFYITPSSGSHLLSLGYSLSSRVLDMDLLQFLTSLSVLLLSGTGVTDTLRTSLDPSLEICILWGWRYFRGIYK